MGWLTEARKSLIVGVFIAVATGTAAVIAVAWAVAALVVGTITLARLIGGWG
jgi:hypothetical protein